ncbi:MAG: class I SAM-dependent methyltransferase [Actinomycetota bacterium]|nr:class I SAM-dependent methyltransferase [Actinomycetota bacterium]
MNLQEAHYRSGTDYRVGSPHLQHWSVHSMLTGVIVDSITATRARGLPATVLEIGAGHGGMTEAVLARGYQVTATEMSQASVRTLAERFGTNDRLRVVHDPDGSMQELGTAEFSTVLCCSVLHHIPDYLGFLQRALPRHLAAGGSMITVQDPLRYDRMPALSHRLDRAAYLTWRMATQGNRLAGLATLARRVRGAYDASKPGDMIEYHVVRNGVDADALLSWLERHFEEVSVLRYWSNQSALAQRLGERLRITNTFALQAKGYRKAATG